MNRIRAIAYLTIAYLTIVNAVSRKIWAMEPSLDCYRVRNEQDVLTPALAIYPDVVDANIQAALRAMDSDPSRWRPHLKTSKAAWVIQRLRAAGVANFKCSTTLELRVACEAGAADVLVAYPMVGRNAQRVREISAAFPATDVSVLVESEAQADRWRGTGIGLFIDVNPGMDRTGVPQECAAEIVKLAVLAGAQFRGLHYYDGQIADPVHVEREQHAHHGYDQLMTLVADLKRAGVPAREVITSGSPAFPSALSYAPFREGSFVHRVSPGTIVFNDSSSLGQMPSELGFQAAVLVIATVVSHPAPGRVTCNAGHKSVSADAGVPNCSVVGYPAFRPLKPSEEHLPIEIPTDADTPRIGAILYLLPRHVCPTVNNFDEAVIVERGEISRLEPVNARGHESPLPGKRSLMNA